MKKNIWIFNHYATTMFFDRGGRHYWFAKNLIKKGYNPLVFCSSVGHNNSMSIEMNGELFKEKIIDEIPFIFIKTTEYKSNGLSRLINMFSFFINVIRTSKRINRKPDILLASSVHPLTLIAGIIISKRFKIPNISEVRDLWPESIVAYGALKKNSFVAKLLYFGEKQIYKKSDSIIMTWPGGRQYIIDQEWNNQIDVNKIHHINNGVYLEDFIINSKIDYYDEDLNNMDYKNFVYTGSIRKVNNIEKLVDAAQIIQSKNNKVKILIYGDGDEKEKLEEKCRNESINNIVFKGKVAKSVVPSIISKSYVNILHNSSTELDKYGSSQNKLFEYLAAGKCIIQTYSTNYNIIEDNDCGVTLETQSPEEIAKTMIYLSENPKMVTEKGKRARLLSLQYDFTILTDKLINIIENQGY